jgi:hypothetical protein
MAIPTSEQIGAIPLAKAGEYELNEAETRKTRAFIYSINKDGIRKYRTIREGRLLMVWRIK